MPAGNRPQDTETIGMADLIRVLRLAEAGRIGEAGATDLLPALGAAAFNSYITGDGELTDDGRRMLDTVGPAYRHLLDGPPEVSRG